MLGSELPREEWIRLLAPPAHRQVFDGRLAADRLRIEAIRSRKSAGMSIRTGRPNPFAVSYMIG